jgi:hypothetical protein
MKILGLSAAKTGSCSHGTMMPAERVGAWRLKIYGEVGAIRAARKMIMGGTVSSHVPNLVNLRRLTVLRCFRSKINQGQVKASGAIRASRLVQR